MKNLSLALLIPMLMLASVGCDSGEREPTGNQSVVSLGSPVVTSVKPEHLGTSELRKAYNDRVMEAHVAMRGLIKANGSWEQLSRQADVLLAEHADSEYAYMWKQVVASYLLKSSTLAREMNAGSTEGVYRYAEMAVQNGSPDGEMIVKTLDSIGSLLDEEDRISLASHASENVAKFIGARAECPGCDPAEILSRNLNQDVVVPSTQVELAVASLERLDAMRAPTK